MEAIDASSWSADDSSAMTAPGGPSPCSRARVVSSFHDDAVAPRVPRFYRPPPLSWERIPFAPPSVRQPAPRTVGLEPSDPVKSENRALNMGLKPKYYAKILF